LGVILNLGGTATINNKEARELEQHYHKLERKKETTYIGSAEKVFPGGRSQESVAGRFRLCCPCFLYQAMYYKKDNARFLKVPILFSQHEHRTLTGQKLYFKRVLPLFSKPYLVVYLQMKDIMT
jgi:hypothetical protein